MSIVAEVREYVSAFAGPTAFIVSQQPTGVCQIQIGVSPESEAAAVNCFDGSDGLTNDLKVEMREWLNSHV